MELEKSPGTTAVMDTSGTLFFRRGITWSEH